MNLRDLIQQGRRADVHENNEQLLDSTAFWRNTCKKLQKAEQQLRAKILVLEQKLETVPDTSSQTTQSTDTSQWKRKRENPPATTRGGGRAAKKAKTTEAIAVFHEEVELWMGREGDGMGRGLRKNAMVKRGMSRGLSKKGMGPSFVETGMEGSWVAQERGEGWTCAKGRWGVCVKLTEGCLKEGIRVGC